MSSHPSRMNQQIPNLRKKKNQNERMEEDLNYLRIPISDKTGSSSQLSSKKKKKEKNRKAK